MIPGSFDAATSREMVGDERARSIEQKARQDADAGVYDPPNSKATTYWGMAQEDFATMVYATQYKRRMERIVRTA